MRSALVAVLVAPAVRAEVPIPTYPDCGEDDPSACPSDLGEQWELIGWIPEHSQASVRPAELELGSGLAADEAWRITTGRFDVILAVVDSGIEWNNTHIVNKIHVNTGELPRPRLADGVEADDYDTDGNGLVNVQDWALDPRVSVDAGRDVADGMLDPSDLIYTFSDGVDDDGNGYVDDIAGWDFFGRDNDAWHEYHDGFGDHGSGVAEEMAAEGEDGNGTIGSCPNCSILPVRIGDTFITDGTRAGEGIAFAVDSGAVGITQAVGALTDPLLAQDAVAYAQEMGVSIVAAAGDENAYHHNFPAMLPGVLYVHSIRFDTSSDERPVYSYMNTWNCNNYGARVDVVAPSHACATGAVAQITGVVGLVHSAAKDAGIELSAQEVYQLIIGTVDDVALTEEEREESRAYPSKEGWDAFYGYGRIDAGKAVAAIAAGEIPPSITLDGPNWFDTFDPARQSSLDIVGALSADRSSGFDYRLAYGLGSEPDQWTELGGGAATAPVDGVLGTLDLSAVPAAMVPEATSGEGVVERLERVNGPAVTVRVDVTDAQGRSATMRRTFFVQSDPDQLSGFPVHTGGSAESSPILVDLDEDGVFEVVLGNADGTVLALHGDGSFADGWPVETSARPDRHSDAEAYASGAVDDRGNGILAGPAAGDLDGDGSPEVVVATIRGALHAFHADGSPVDGFPVWSVTREPGEFDDDHPWDNGFASAPTLSDLDGDGSLEIVLAGLDQRLYVLGADGTDWGPYPVTLCYPTECATRGTRIIASPTVGDLDGDGDVDIVLGTNEGVDDGRFSVTYMLDARTAESLPGWPLLQSGLASEAVVLPLIGEGHPASVAVADVDGDGDLELFDPIMLGTTDPMHHDGSPYVELPYHAIDWPSGTNADNVTALVQMVSNPSIGDITGDGVPDFVLGGSSPLYLAALAVSQHMDFQHGIGAWDGSTGEMLPGWPRQIEDLQFLIAPAIADVSGDGRPEVIYGSAGYLVHAWDATGTEAAGWPKFTGNWLLGSPAVGDITGDGLVDVVVTSREGNLFAWSTRGSADQAVQWQSLHHDAANTGNHETTLPTQLGPEHVALNGCCAGHPGGDDRAWLVGPLAFGALGRRRRRHLR